MHAKFKKITYIILFTFTLFNVVSCSTHTNKIELPTYVKIQENNLLECCLPKIPSLTPIERTKADALFKLIKNEKLEYRDISRSCEDRAQYTSLFLNKHNIKTGKIWVIAPVRHSLLTQETLKIKDPLNSEKQISWGYHIAPFLTVKERGKSKIMIIDPSISKDSLIEKNKWLMKLNSPRAVYFFSESDDYGFNSLNGLKVYHKMKDKTYQVLHMPTWFPNILTGDMQKYRKERTREIVLGLSINDIRAKIYDKYLTKNKKKFSEELLALKEMTSTKNKIIELLTKNKIKNISTDSHTFIKDYYKSRSIHWYDKINELNQYIKQ